MEIYRHVGERARTDFIKKAGSAGIADARLRTITARFDEVRDARQMIADLDEGWFTNVSMLYQFLILRALELQGLN